MPPTRSHIKNYQIIWRKLRLKYAVHFSHEISYLITRPVVLILSLLNQKVILGLE